MILLADFFLIDNCIELWRKWWLFLCVCVVTSFTFWNPSVSRKKNEVCSVLLIRSWDSQKTVGFPPWSALFDLWAFLRALTCLHRAHHSVKQVHFTHCKKMEFPAMSVDWINGLGGAELGVLLSRLLPDVSR